MLAAFCSAAAWADVAPPNADRLAEIRAGRLDTARADWWGFDSEDSTAMLQAAVTSGVRKLTIPNLGRPWIVSPIKLSSNIAIDVEPGTVVEAICGDASRGEIWMLQTSMPGQYGIEDYEIDLFGVPPILSTTREGLYGE